MTDYSGARRRDGGMAVLIFLLILILVGAFISAIYLASSAIRKLRHAFTRKTWKTRLAQWLAWISIGLILATVATFFYLIAQFTRKATPRTVVVVLALYLFFLTAQFVTAVVAFVLVPKKSRWQLRENPAILEPTSGLN